MSRFKKFIHRLWIELRRSSARQPGRLAHGLARLLVVSAFANPAFGQTVLYDNGPLDSAAGGWGISPGQYISNSFTISSTATITGVTFGDWSQFIGSGVTSVDWAIGILPMSSSLGSGSAAPSNSFVGIGLGIYELYYSTFSVPSITVAPGTYYLSLGNAGPNFQYWGRSPLQSSIAYGNSGSTAGFNQPSSQIDGFVSESFQINGTVNPVTAIPEPETYALLLAGLGLLGFAVRHRKQKEAAA